MDRHAEWVKAQHELSEASKAVHLWDAMPRELRIQIGVGRYREKRAEARRRFKQADRLCREAGVANRVEMRFQGRHGQQAA